LGHHLVPNHEILEKKEADELLANNRLDLDQLPRILDDDPAILEIGGKPGDIIKITRKSRTAGTAVSYRFVVRNDLK